MDPLTSVVLLVALAAVGYYVLYIVIRRAVANGIRDARREPEPVENAGGESRSTDGTERK